MFDIGGTSELVLRYAGWAYIPQTATRICMNVLYGSILRRPAPQYGTEEYVRVWRRTYAFVILSYLGYNLFTAAQAEPPNYYQMLGVKLDADENVLKTAFRNFARRNHPDKVGIAGTDLFAKVRDAYDALRNPVKRFAYDRFGPASFHFEHVITEDEYMHAGLLQIVAFYVVSLFFMIVYGVLGDSDSGAIWRYLLFFYLLACELNLYLLPVPNAVAPEMFPIRSASQAFPWPVTVLRWIFPQWLPYQIVSFLRQVNIALSIAIARVMPVLWPERENNDKVWIGTMQKVFQSAVAADQQVMRLFQNQLTEIQGASETPVSLGRATPFPDDETVGRLRVGMENQLVESMVRGHPMLNSKWRDAVQAGYAAQSTPEPTAETESPTRTSRLTIDTAAAAPRRSVAPPQTSPRRIRLPPSPPSSRSPTLSPPGQNVPLSAASTMTMSPVAHELLALSPMRDDGPSRRSMTPSYTVVPGSPRSAMGLSM